MTTTLTHRRQDKNLTSNVMLFADDERNAHYGNHVWTLKTELPEIGKREIEFAMEFYGVDHDEAEALVNPENIVDTAGAWDDQQFVSDIYQTFEPVGYITQDGAVVLSKEEVELEYRIEE